MVEVPDLIQDSTIAITAKIRYSASLRVKGVRDLDESVCRCIGRKNPCTAYYHQNSSVVGEGVQLNSRGEHIVGRIHLEGLGNSFVEVHNFLMFLVPGLIASDVKCRCASGMLRELVAVLLRGSSGK